ncbi:DUF2242 domain-containing protein [Variovorax sp. OV329]|uniref:DUF2242 domain-containing protein n=1 Tax=Variovorax sp. OV329 TaxID=1882825 RepID=UPI0008E5AD76|nr:DUF2242 domain-containing protein [Variovorax sp. OV329]SFM98504.1 hypothetical protein SAMN05444747_112111 [Variovorax sp. OV329]
MAVALALVLAGCKSTPQRVSYDPEAFGSTDTHTRVFEASEAQTCEAARRALLSQGYLVLAANTELVNGKKSFQPAPEVHVELDFRVVCATETGGSSSRKRASATPPRTLVFVSALQDRYSLKKVNNSASLGVGVIGSVSLPYSSSDDSLVKVASQTVTDERFYDRFFAIVQRYIVVNVAEPEPAVAAPVLSSSVVAQPLAVQTLAPLPPVGQDVPSPAPSASSQAQGTAGPQPAAQQAPQVQTAAPQAQAQAQAPQPVQMRAPPLPVEPLGEPSSMPAKATSPSAEASAAEPAAQAARN